MTPAAIEFADRLIEQYERQGKFHGKYWERGVRRPHVEEHLKSKGYMLWLNQTKPSIWSVRPLASQEPLTVREKIEAGRYRGASTPMPANREEFLESLAEEKAEQERLNALFKQDALKETRLALHVKADLAFELAMKWTPHDDGTPQDTLEILEELADLLNVKTKVRKANPGS